MKKLPSSVQGLLFGPALISLFFILKAFCPDSAGDSCFADQFAVPIFLPLVAIYRIFGSSDIIGGQEFLFIVLYWALIGFLIGLILDLCKRMPALSKELIEIQAPPVPAAKPVVPPSALILKSTEFAPVMKAPMPSQPLPPPLKPPINLLDRPEYK